MDIFSPKRKITTRTRGVRGIVPNAGHYESTLERDFMELLKFDSTVDSIKPQPVTIPYKRRDGTSSTYTPDGLVFYKQHVVQRPLLYEIKYRDELKANREEIFPKLRAAKEFALNNHWNFGLYTEYQIRTPYLTNIRFLTRFLDLSISSRCETFILDLLTDCSEAAVSYFLTMLGDTKLEQANILPYVWHLLAIGKIGCDLSKQLTMDSIIYAEAQS